LFGEDRADSAWLARITGRGSVASSFVPPEPVRRLTRQRMHARRQARTHISSLQRLGYKVTIHAINPDTGELQPPPPEPPLTVTHSRLPG